MKTKMVLIKDLHMNLFVRESLNQDHALFLAELIQNKVKLPPIKVTPDLVVIDGRHRIEAHELNDLTQIEVEVLELTDEIRLISEAYKSNIGGSLPPTTQDTEHTVMLLLERRETKKRIGELLNLPAGMARKYVNSVESKIARQKLRGAVEAVTDGGLTVPKAAEQHGVDTNKLKEALSGHKKKNKWGVAEVQRNLTSRFRSEGQKNARLIMSLIEKYEDGDVSEKQVKDIFTHIEKLQQQSTRSVVQWKKRFNGKNGK
jgi:ParB-like chromosome segregation protein Spo0J